MLSLKSKSRAAAGSQYAMLLGLIGVVVLLAAVAMGSNVNTLMTRVGNTLCVVTGGCAGAAGAATNSGGGGGGGNPGDTTPDAFSFSAVTNAAQNTLYTSNTLQITGMTSPAVISISGNGSPQYRICADAACGTVISPFGATPGTINNLNYVTVRITSSDTPLVSRVASLTVGDVVGEYLVTSDNGGLDAQVQTVSGGVYNVKFALCGGGTITGCNEATAKSSCTALGMKLVAHASDGGADVLSLGATASCNSPSGYYNTINTAFDDGTRCLIAPANVDWGSGSCCAGTHWHGRTIHIGNSSTPNWGIIHTNDSGRNNSYANSATNSSGWGCYADTSAAALGGVTGCGASSFYVPCALDNANGFSFTDLTEQPVSSVIESNTVQINGTGSTAALNVNGPANPQYQTCTDAACSNVVTPWRSGSGDIAIGHYLRIRQTTPQWNNLTVTANITVGVKTVKWNVRTILAADGVIKTVAGTDLPVMFVPCGTGTITNCNEATAKASCAALGQKLYAHATVNSSSMVTLGASASCNASSSYLKTTSGFFNDGTKCLVSMGAIDWSTNCCANVNSWHGRTMVIGPTTHPSYWGVVNGSDSGKNVSYPNDLTNTQPWGCTADTNAASANGVTGCGANSFYVACTAP